MSEIRQMPALGALVRANPLARFDFQELTPYPPKRKKHNGRPKVTIAVGFVCSDGVVLCTDRQVTDPAGFKYQDDKIHTVIGDGWVVVSAYAGFSDLMRTIQDRLFAYLQDDAQLPRGECVQEFLGRTLSSLRKTSARELAVHQMLCAVSTKSDTRLFKTHNSDVHEVLKWECLGLADSALVRYLADKTGIVRFERNWTQALMVGLYMVSQANEYILDCNGGPDSAVIGDGACHLRWGSQIDMGLLKDGGENLAAFIMDFVNCVAVPDSAFDTILPALPDKIRAARKAMRKFWGSCTRPR